MRGNVQGFRPRARAQADELLQAIAAAEQIIVSTIERECEALRAGRMLAAGALRTRLRDAAALYLNAMRAARASIWTLEQIVPGTQDLIEERRAAFSALLKVELAILATERLASGESELDFAVEPGLARLEPEQRKRPKALPPVRVVAGPEARERSPFAPRGKVPRKAG